MFIAFVYVVSTEREIQMRGHPVPTCALGAAPRFRWLNSVHARSFTASHTLQANGAVVSTVYSCLERDKLRLNCLNRNPDYRDKVCSRNWANQLSSMFLKLCFELKELAALC